MEGGIIMEFIKDDLPQSSKGLEEFVYHVYYPDCSTDLSALRWELFCSKNLEGDIFPSTRATVLSHITRATSI